MSYELRQWTPHNRVSLLEDRGGQRDRYERSGGGGERGYHDYRQYKRERTASLPRAERSREHERERERSRERSGDPAGYRSRSQGVALAAAAQQHHHDSHFYPDSPPMRTPSPASSRPRQSQRSRSQVQQFHNASFSSANDAPEYRSPTTTLSFHNTSSESATNRASYDPAERAAQQQQQQQRPSWREGLARAKEQSRSIGDAYSREERGGGGGGGDVWRAGNGASGTAGGRSAHVEQLLAQLRQERAQGKKLRDGGGAGAGAGGDRRRRSLPTSDARASSAVGASVEPPLGRPPRSASTPRSLPREDAEPTRAASAALPPAAGGGGASYAQGKRSPGLSQAEYERLRRRNKEWQEDLQRRRDRCGSRGGAGSGSGGGGGGGGEAGGDAAEAIA
eukprot:Rhum_TRINITY_DN14468_c2_g1::Rhum_TRINITY_DN14468_c2_g1_i1::g.89749::m.89749